jgi:ATP adenylyltransferase/5',5'''-P-1,P-4-tetraphosphate phosphorylase II
MFFNCGKDGGCSRLHKHMQIAPFLKDRLAPWPELSTQSIKAPYEYILRRFGEDLGPKQVADIYGQMMTEARKILGPDTTSSNHIPHNLILGRSWILVIPRRKPGVGGAYSNSLGMIGMVSVASNEELKCWIDQGPAQVISQLGVSTSVNQSTGTTDTNGSH